MSLAMVVANPARTPILVAMLVFAFWKMKNERRLREVEATLASPVGP
jgi:hypothetical protein